MGERVEENQGNHFCTFIICMYIYSLGGGCMFVKIRFYLFPVYKFLPFSAGNHLFCIIFDEEKGGVWRYLVRYCMEYYP
jgi:hypothetical protein